MHDPRVGRFFAVDPLEKEFLWNSPYAFAENKVIAFTELEGAESLYYQVSLDKNTGKPIIKHVDTKESWLDPFVPFHLVVSINGGNYQYYSDFTQDDIDEGLMQKRLEWIAKNPKLAQAKIDANTERARIDSEKSKEDIQNLFVNAFTIAWGVKNGNKYSVGSYRKDLAVKWMGSMSKTKYVDFNSPVFTKTINKGTKLIQYRVKGTEGYFGDYYALPRTKPEQIGLDPKDVVATYNVIVKKKTEVLFSTHTKDATYYADSKIKLEGGGTQIYSKELKNSKNSTFTKQ